MADSKESSKQQQDSKSSHQEPAKSSSKRIKRKTEAVVFNEDDLYKVKYDF